MQKRRLSFCIEMNNLWYSEIQDHHSVQPWLWLLFLVSSNRRITITTILFMLQIKQNKISKSLYMVVPLSIGQINVYKSEYPMLCKMCDIVNKGCRKRTAQDEIYVPSEINATSSGVWERWINHIMRRKNVLDKGSHNYCFISTLIIITIITSVTKDTMQVFSGLTLVLIFYL